MSPAVNVPATNTSFENVAIPMKVDNPDTDKLDKVVDPFTSTSPLTSSSVPTVAIPVIFAFHAVNSSKNKSSAIYKSPPT